MSIVNINNVFIPVHWNDRFYEADCGECGFTEMGRTLDEIRQAIIDHACVSV